MKCSILVPSTAAASRAILGVEIADTIQTSIETANHVGITANNENYVYKLVHVTYSVDEFLNNYNQYFFSGTTVYKSAGYAVNNRRLLDTATPGASNYFDRSVPYAENMIHSLV